VPDNATFASAADGGIFGSGEVVWNAGDVAHLSEVSVSFAVTATTSLTDIVNSTYSFTATNQLDPIAGEEVVTTVGNAVRIHDIQGAAHISPFDGDPVADVPGIVTVLDSGSNYNGFYMQDPSPDSDDKTAEGIFVFTNGAPGVTVGDMVYVSGFVGEFRAVGFHPDFSVGPGAPNNLTITRINEPAIEIESSGNTVPVATVIGSGGRMPPTEVIDNDTTGNVETGSTTFDPANDGIDFYESLEGMLVQVNDAVVVGATRSFGDIAVLADNGAHATGTRTDNGGIIAQETDFNPERIILTDDIGDTPNINVGTVFTTPIVGVIDYSFGNYKLQPLEDLSAPSGSLAPDNTTLEGGAKKLTVATFNVENLDPGDSSSKFSGLATTVVDGLGSPDIIALQEIQDNNGTTDDGTVDASETYTALIQAISSAGGPTYDWRDIAPENNQDGGAPGGNIRVGYLFNPSRVTFVDRGNGGATDAVTVTQTISGTQLSLSPGRIDPTDSAWDGGRKSLAAEFLFNGETVFLINNHLKSKSEDDPLFGKFQPPVLHTQPQRDAQAQIVNDFVDAILSADAGAQIVVLGDLNEFQFRPALSILEGDVLTNLWPKVPVEDQYSFVFDGNSQVLDHILISRELGFALPAFDVVHVNIDRYETSQAADHDPLLVQLTIPSERLYMPIIMK
jgi:predicted extracellular nuclease